MTRFLTLDHVYPEAFSALPHANHEKWFENGCFGTSDFLDIALRAAGHEAKTLVRNFFGPDNSEIYEAARAFEPDVIISQEAGRFDGPGLRKYFPHAKLVCNCSHHVGNPALLSQFDVIFSSFPWMPKHCESLGMRCEYQPLAFGRPTLGRLGELPKERDIDVAFVGGIGYGIWDHATDVLAEIAEAIPSFVWYGYTAGHQFARLPPALQRAYKGEVWGIDYHRLLHRIKILVNRHGDIAARGGKLFGNNLRQYEGIGNGCRLLTDDLGEIEHCWRYADAPSAISAIQFILQDWDHQAEQARDGQRWLLANHCYENRVPEFLRIIESL